MSINEYVISVEDRARGILAETGALVACPAHSDVTIRVGDIDKEKHAYALATTRLKYGGEMEIRTDLTDAIKDELDMAADGECPRCAGLMRE